MVLGGVVGNRVTSYFAEVVSNNKEVSKQASNTKFIRDRFYFAKLTSICAQNRNLFFYKPSFVPSDISLSI